MSVVSSNYAKVVKRFGKKPEVSVFSPTEYRVAVQDWHVHDGAMSSRPFADGTTLENACRRLLEYCDRPAVLLVDSSDCDHTCAATYSKSPQCKASRGSLMTVVERASKEVDSWPAWKRGLAPCADEDCEREADHKGKHRRALPVQFKEW